MSKNEFLTELSNALIGQVSEREYQNSMTYYSEYIDNALRAGRNEKEVVNELGSGRLIAKSIIEAYVSENEGESLFSQEPSYSSGYSYQTEEKEDSMKQKKFNFNTWYGVVLKILILIAVLWVIGFLFKWVILPVAVIALAVYFIKKLLRS